MSDVQRAAEPSKEPARGSGLREAVQRARMEMAERTGVVIDLRDAELVRLEILNEALEPLFADVPPGIDLFDRGLLPSDPPRLFIDMVAHVVMGRDKRVYRFVQDTRHGRKILAESTEVPVLVEAITRYVARRLVERERALRGDPAIDAPPAARVAIAPYEGARLVLVFLGGVALGMLALLAAAMFIP